MTSVAESSVSRRTSRMRPRNSRAASRRASSPGYSTIARLLPRRFAASIVAGLQQIEQERQLLIRIPRQVVVQRVADDQLGVLVAQVGGVDGLDRPPDGLLGG